MKTLISMTDYILNLSTEYPKGKSLHDTDWSKEFEQFSKLVISYAEFLKQPLKLEMFVPCDEYGNILKEYKISPSEREADLYNYPRPISIEEHNWRKAKEKVLFENIPIAQAKWLVNTFSTIEHLSDIANTISPIYLTENAIKQIGL